jgi:hypothetical protein
MFSRKAETRYKKLWFGLFARVTIGPWFLHKSGIGPLPIPHPSLANRLLRQGLPDDLSDDLSFAHEFAHLQTAPLILLYMLAILLLVHARGRVSLTVVLIVLASVQAAWEIVSEGPVILQDPVRYRMSYAAVTMLHGSSSGPREAYLQPPVPGPSLLAATTAIFAGMRCAERNRFFLKSGDPPARPASILN